MEYLDDADVVSGGTLTKHLANKTEKRAPALLRSDFPLKEKVGKVQIDFE